MKFRKSWKRFWTLDRHHSDGFTLVELIVVIAIIAILAGVGTVGYSGYIKSANKNADKVLVGNIIRAIETGTNSYAFVGDDSFKLGSIAYPVGFVTLSPTGGIKIMVSGTTPTEAVTDKCVFKTVSNAVVVTSATVNWTCSATGKSSSASSKEGYIIETRDITYCTTHTTAAMLASGLRTIAAEESYITSYICTKTGSHYSHNWRNNPVSTNIAANSVVADPSNLYQASAVATMCEYAYANQFDTFGTPGGVVEASAGNPLYDSITAAFGSDLSALKLSYDGWTSEEGVSFATLYNSAPVLMEDVETLSALLAAGSTLFANRLGLTQSYKNGEEVLTVVSSTVATTHTLEAWLAWWDNDVNKTQGETAMTWDSYGFGLTGRENYSAARMAYNNAFASYLETRGEAQYFDIFNEFYSQEVVGVGLPGLICNDAFTDPDSPLVEDIPDEAERKRLHEIYKEYVKSDALIENGKAVYNIFATFDETSDVANAYTEMNGGSIYDYYDGYVNEINALYEGAQAAANGGIVIVVVVENGQLNFLVSPAVANPRKD